jgi:RNA polymerase sigma-70 factor (ECF subfamily)
MTESPDSGPPRPDDLETTIFLLDRARGGDRNALNVVYARYWPRLYRWASGRLPASARPMEETGDVVQRVLERFLANLDTFRPRHDGALMAYLCTSVMNRIRDAARQSQRRPQQVAVDDRDLAAADPSPYELCVAKDVRERYTAALSRLDEDQRCAVILKLELDLGPTEIARALDKPSPDAARMYTERAIRRLAEEMADG